MEDAAREADLIDDLAAALVDAPRLVMGSQGQQVINPLISSFVCIGNSGSLLKS